ncbi:respiratory nitrate reductase subunit gamma, partial [Mesorhizobium sp. M2C.T.Ca.TU.002.02.1.1]
WYLGRPGYQVVRTRFATRRPAVPAPAVRSSAPARRPAATPSHQPAE